MGFFQQTANVVKISAPDFNLAATLDSGQVFGFTTEAGIYRGVVCGKPLKLSQNGDELHTEDDGGGVLAEAALKKYFDLARDMTPVYAALGSDERLKPLLAPLKGMRLVRQDPWEALASFIISANNNVKRIQLIWRNLSTEFTGSPHRFPLPQLIAASTEARLKKLGLGYRARYLLSTSRQVAADPAAFNALADMPYEEAKMRLMEFQGVGPKVADCVLVYGFQNYEAFPVDVWVLRGVRNLFFRRRKITEKKAAEFGRKRWGPICGYVQHYIFYGTKCGYVG